ncbi:MAG: hypothetical protein VB125_01900 [Burkholderia sp.]
MAGLPSFHGAGKSAVFARSVLPGNRSIGSCRGAQPHDGTCSSAVRPHCLRSKTWESLRPYVNLCNNAPRGPPVRQRSCHLPPDRKIVSKQPDPVHKRVKRCRMRAAAIKNGTGRTDVNRRKLCYSCRSDAVLRRARD